MSKDFLQGCLIIEDARSHLQSNRILGYHQKTVYDLFIYPLHAVDQNLTLALHSKLNSYSPFPLSPIYPFNILFVVLTESKFSGIKINNTIASNLL
jgi:hypothetical protein